MTEETNETSDPNRFRRTLIRVLTVQVITLVGLYLLQYMFRQ